MIKEEPSLPYSIERTHLWCPGGVFKLFMCLWILLFLNSSFIVHFLTRFGGRTIGCFLWMCDPMRCLKGQLYNRFICNNYRSFVNSLLHLVRSYVVMVFTYVKVATIKLRKTKFIVVQLRVSYWVNGHQENYGHHRQEFRQLARDSSCC